MTIDTRTLYRTLGLQPRNLHKGLSHGSKRRLRVTLKCGDKTFEWERDYVVQIIDWEGPMKTIEGRLSVNFKGVTTAFEDRDSASMYFFTDENGGVHMEVMEPIGHLRYLTTSTSRGDWVEIMYDCNTETSYDGVEMTVEVLN